MCAQVNRYGQRIFVRCSRVGDASEPGESRFSRLHTQDAQDRRFLPTLAGSHNSRFPAEINRGCWTGQSVCLRGEWRDRNAVTTDIDGAGGGRSSVVAGEQLHTDAGANQVDFEWRGGDRRGFVAIEHFRTFSFAQPYSNWNVSKPERERMSEIRCTQTINRAGQ